MSDQPAADRVIFYPAWVSNRAARERGTSLMFGKACDTAAEAAAIGRAELAAGRATLAYVVKFAGGVKTPLLAYVRPKSAQVIIEHWLELCEATEGAGGAGVR